MGSLTVPVTGLVSGLNNNIAVNTGLLNAATMVQGPTAPTTGSTGLSSLAGLWWHDTGNNLIKLRDHADANWITVATVDESNKLVYGQAVRSTPQVAGSKTYALSDRGAATIRSNSGSAMTDTVPVSGGYSTFIINADSAASLALSPASGTIDGVSSITLSPGQSVQYVADGTNGYTIRGAAPSANQGGFLNKFRNGTMDVWQRGTSGSVTAGNSAYSADGWIVGAAGATVSWGQGGVRSGGATRVSMSITGASGVTDAFLRQRIEGSIAAPLAGQIVTVQAQVKNNTLSSITPTLTVRRAGSTDVWSSGVSTDVSGQSFQACPAGAWDADLHKFHRLRRRFEWA